MTALEISFVSAGLLSLLILSHPERKAKSWGRMLLVAAALLALCHLMIQPYRWQALPAYVGVLALCLVEIATGERIFRWRRFTSCAIALLFLVAVALGTVYPVFQLPQPTGAYRIGTVTYHLVDPHRAEVLSPTPGARREVMIQAWYPADSAGAQAAPYREGAATRFQNAYLTQVRTHAWVGVPVAKAQPNYPVLLFSPSWHGVRNQSMFQIEELVSHGFIVVGVDHPYGSAVTVFPDGRMIWARPDKFLDTSTEGTLRDSLQDADEQVHIRASDLVFVLDRLQAINSGDRLGILTGRLDLNRVGVFGYSFGGAVAMQACWMDQRFKAALDLDGLLFGESSKDGIQQPLLVITDTLEPGSPKSASSISPRSRWTAILHDEARMIRQDASKPGDYIVEIPQAGHGNFSDAALFSRLRRLTERGPIDRTIAMRIINDYSVAFFEKSLNHSPQPLLEGTVRPYTESRLTAYPHP